MLERDLHSWNSWKNSCHTRNGRREIKNKKALGVNCLSYNLLLKQSRGIITSLSKLLEPNVKYLVAIFSHSRQANVAAANESVFVALVSGKRMKQSLECRLCFMQIMSVIIYLFHSTARLCTAIISSLEFRFRYSCQSWQGFQTVDNRIRAVISNVQSNKWSNFYFLNLRFLFHLLWCLFAKISLFARFQIYSVLGNKLLFSVSIFNPPILNLYHLEECTTFSSPLFQYFSILVEIFTLERAYLNKY